MPQLKTEGRSSFSPRHCQTSQDICSNNTLHVYLSLKINISPAFALIAELQLTYHRDVQNVPFEVLFINPHKWKLQGEWFSGKTPHSLHGRYWWPFRYTWHFPYSLSGSWKSSKRKHFCNKHKLKVNVCQWGTMLRPYLGSMRIKHVKYFCDRYLSLSGNYLFAIPCSVRHTCGSNKTVTPSDVTSYKPAHTVTFGFSILKGPCKRHIKSRKWNFM